MYKHGAPPPAVAAKGEEEKIIEAAHKKALEDSVSYNLARDDASIYKFGPHVQVEFDDIFDESRDFQNSSLGQSVGVKVNHGCLRSIFDCCNSGTFYVLSVLIGWISALLCGIVYGLNMTVQVWCVQPCIKLIFTWLRLCFACNRAYVRACLDPCFQSIGQSFAYIRGRFKSETTRTEERGGYGTLGDK